MVIITFLVVILFKSFFYISISREWQNACIMIIKNIAFRMTCNIISFSIIIIILLFSKNKNDEIKCFHGEKCFLPFMPFLEAFSGITHALSQHNWEYVLVPPHLLPLYSSPPCISTLWNKEIFISIFIHKKRKFEKKNILLMIEFYPKAILSLKYEIFKYVWFHYFCYNFVFSHISII